VNSGRSGSATGSAGKARYGLLLVVLLGLGVRLLYVAVGVERACTEQGLPADCLLGDQTFYNAAANRLADGEGFVEPFAPGNPFEASDEPAADHPPLTLLVYAPVSWLADVPPLEWIDDDTTESHARLHRLWSAVLGTLTVGLIGLLGRRVGEPLGAHRADQLALVAAGLAAVYPPLWINDGVVMSEAITNVVVVGTLIAAYDFARRRDTKHAAILGAMCGLSALARAELLLFTALLVLPVVGAALRSDRRSAARLFGAAAVATAVMIGPWVVYNNARFAEPTFISTNDGLAMAGSNCDDVYSGTAIGLTSLSVECNGTGVTDDTDHPSGDQSQQSREWRRRAFEYIGDHAGRLPAVVAARVGRVWGVFRPYDMVSYNVGEGRPEGISRVAITVHFPMLLVAGFGAWWLRRRRVPIGPLVAPLIVVTVGAAITYGQARFRAAAEPALLVFAAAAVIAVIATIERRVLSGAADQGSRQADTA
jgi:hypothetical protein